MQCDLCAEPFTLFRDAQLHHLKAHNQAGYLYCCDRKFFKMYKAVQHCMWHDDPESFKWVILRENFEQVASQIICDFKKHGVDGNFCSLRVQRDTNRLCTECCLSGRTVWKLGVRWVWTFLFWAISVQSRSNGSHFIMRNSFRTSGTCAHHTCLL